MTDPSRPIPPPRPDDDEDVHWALSTAAALWARGDTGEAIKWLRRAAETASDQNRDQRSLELFKAAADATSRVEAGLGATAPQGPPPGSHQVSAPPAPPAPPVRTSALPQQPQPQPQPRLPAAPPAMPSPSGLAGRPSALPPLGSGKPPLRQGPPSRVVTQPMPTSVANARALLKQTLPSNQMEEAVAAAETAQRESASATPSPSPTSRVSPSSPAARRSEQGRRNTLDQRFQFPDEEVTVERDLAALKRPRPLERVGPEVTPSSPIVSAIASTAPHPAAGAQGAESVPVITPPPPPVRSPTAPGPGPLYVSSSRTVLSPGQPVRAAALQPPSSAAVTTAAPVISSARPTVARGGPPSDDHTPLDSNDLDEQTSVLAGDEPELDYNRDTNEVSRAEEDSGTPEHRTPTPDHVSRAEDAPGAPSIRPEPMPQARPSASSAASRWTAIRVAVRRDGSGVRIEALALDAQVPPGAVPAVLVAHDPATADALARLFEKR